MGSNPADQLDLKTAVLYIFARRYKTKKALDFELFGSLHSPISEEAKP